MATQRFLLAPVDRTGARCVVIDGLEAVLEAVLEEVGAAEPQALARDRECFHPTCDEPAGRCQVDHLEPWPAGGRTVAANGRPACGFHNRARHRGPPPGA